MYERKHGSMKHKKSVKRKTIKKDEIYLFLIKAGKGEKKEQKQGN